MTISTILQAEHLGVRRFVVCNPLWVRSLKRTLPTRWETQLNGNSLSNAEAAPWGDPLPTRWETQLNGNGLGPTRPASTSSSHSLGNTIEWKHRDSLEPASGQGFPLVGKHN